MPQSDIYQNEKEMYHKLYTYTQNIDLMEHTTKKM